MYSRPTTFIHRMFYIYVSNISFNDNGISMILVKKVLYIVWNPLEFTENHLKSSEALLKSTETPQRSPGTPYWIALDTSCSPPESLGWPWNFLETPLLATCWNHFKTHWVVMETPLNGPETTWYPPVPYEMPLKSAGTSVKSLRPPGKLWDTLKRPYATSYL